MTERPALVFTSADQDDTQDTDEDDRRTLDLTSYEPDPFGERLNELAARMAAAATPEEATAAAEEFLAIHHQISELTPAALQELTGVLTSISTSLAEVSWQLALGPAEQAVGLYRDLVRAGLRPSGDLSNSLSKLLVFISEMSTCATATSPRNCAFTRDRATAPTGQ